MRRQCAASGCHWGCSFAEGACYCSWQLCDQVSRRLSAIGNELDAGGVAKASVGGSSAHTHALRGMLLLEHVMRNTWLRKNVKNVAFLVRGVYRSLLKFFKKVPHAVRDVHRV